LLFSPAARGENELAQVRLSSLLGLDTILITQVDVVFVYDEALSRELPATKGEWYSLVDEMPADYAARMDVVTTDIPQGFYAQTLVLPDRAREAVRVFAVAYHQSLGTPVRDLTAMRRALIQIDEFGILVSDEN
jgi:hypothetical protein